MTKTDPKNDPNISRTLLIACWGNVRLIAVIAVIPVLVRNQSIISGNIDFSIYFHLRHLLLPELPGLPQFE